MRRTLACLALSFLALAARAQEPVAPIAINEWRVVGPFETGSREGLVNHLADANGRVPRAFEYTQTWPSVLADGGRVKWIRVPAGRDDKGELNGHVAFKLEGVNWDLRASEWGGAAALNTAYASASFLLPESRKLLLEASRCVVVLNGVPVAGDPYGAGIAKSVVRGRMGINDLLVITSGFGGDRAFDLKLTPFPAGEIARIVDSDVLLPDVLAGQPGSGVIGVPIISASDEWLEDISVDVVGGMEGSRLASASLAPLASLKIAVPVKWAATEMPKDEGPSLQMTIRVRQGDRLIATTFAKATVRDPGAVHVETFVSRIDGSAQKFAVLPPVAATPKPFGPPEPVSDRKALVLSLHGAAVEALGQARAYSPKDWAYVVAPTNRRPFGFDWHDWGALDAMEVLDVAFERFPIDPNRVHVSGHSMGGHGAWVIGETRPGLFATVAPSAGWNGYDTYMPTTLRRSVNFAPAELSEMYVRGIAPGRASTLLGNLRNVPVFVLQGADDDNVPPTHARLLSGELERMGADVTYKEVPGQNHWWDLDKTRPGADCVDSAELEAFWKAHVRHPGARRVVFESSDLDLGRDMDWVRILEQQRVAETSRVDAQIGGSVDDLSVPLVVTTRNVGRFALDVRPELSLARNVDLTVDGQALKGVLGKDARTLTLARTDDGQWRVAPRTDRGFVGMVPGSYKKAMFEPFVIVVGTQGLAERNEHALDLARSLALAWWVRANGTSPIVRDTDVTDEMRTTRNLVLIGGPDVNVETKRIEKTLPIVASPAGVTLAGRKIAGDGLASVHWQRSPDAAERRVLVMQATTADADALLYSLNPVGSGQGWPDFIVATGAVRSRSWGGFAAAGWWDPRFGYDPSNTWLASDLN